ncbi:MAG: hypothetical protein LBK08_01560 [Treponema sp.]|jgi:ABC-type phosphate transport system permease subunit|nr:hypothetical protein [Treponema sp.]
MLGLIGKVLGVHSFGMLLVFTLFVMLNNEKSMEKAKEPGVKKLLYISIVLYYLSIIIEVVFSVMQGV